MSFTFKHPKYYKELRKRNKEEARAQLKVPSSNLDQAISDEASTEATSVRPGPGQSGKQQAASNKRSICCQSSIAREGVSR